MTDVRILPQNVASKLPAFWCDAGMAATLACYGNATPEKSSRGRRHRTTGKFSPYVGVCVVLSDNEKICAEAIGLHIVGLFRR